MHRTTVTAAALLALTVGLAGAAFAAAPDSAAKATSASATEATKAATPTKAPAAKPAATTHGASAGAPMKTKAGQDAVVLETVLGNIVIKLADADAPKTVANFRKLVAEKFYDGTCFHRVIPGFMIQGGDPNSKDADPSNDGIGGATTPDGRSYTIPAEIKLKHLRGSVATARQGDQVNPKRDSSSSQFFIDLAPQPSLDAGGYTVFGEVISGMETVDKIAALANEPGVASAGGGGANPQKKALIKRAYLEPLSRAVNQASTKTTTSTTTTTTTTAAAADTTKK